MLGNKGEAVAIQVTATGKTAMVPLTRLSDEAAAALTRLQLSVTGGRGR